MCESDALRQKAKERYLEIIMESEVNKEMDFKEEIDIKPETHLKTERYVNEEADFKIDIAITSF